jgi:phage terminase small subunit
MNILASSDRGQMVGYCDAWGRWCKAKRMLAEMELRGGGIPAEIIRCGNGGWTESPWLRISNRALADLIKYGAELGLNPVQRTRVKMEKAPEQSRRQKLLG